MISATEVPMEPNATFFALRSLFCCVNRRRKRPYHRSYMSLFKHRFTYASDYSRIKGARTSNEHKTTDRVYIHTLY